MTEEEARIRSALGAVEAALPAGAAEELTAAMAALDEACKSGGAALDPVVRGELLTELARVQAQAEAALATLAGELSQAGTARVAVGRYQTGRR